MVKAFKSTLEDLEEKRSIHSLQYLNRQRPIQELSFIDELKGTHHPSDYPYEIRKINILSSLRNHLNNSSLASQLSVHDDDQQSKQLIKSEQQTSNKQQIKDKEQTGFSVIFKSTRSKSKQLNQRALTAPTTNTISSRLPTIRSNSISNDILVDNLVEQGKSTNSPPTSSSNESPLKNANNNATTETTNNPLVQGYHLMHETSI